jgi:uncharacterized membrane protein
MFYFLPTNGGEKCGLRSEGEMESHARSLVKAVSWRICGTAVTFALAWIVTRKLPTAAIIGAADAVTKVGAFYLHERVWQRIAFGKSEG